MTAETASQSPDTIRIDGKQYAADLRARIAEQVARLQGEHDLTPGLAVVLVGDDPASEVYVRNKHRATVEVGMRSFEHKLPDDTSEADLLALVAKLNADPAVNGILVQLPLPGHLEEAVVTQAIDPAKDVDGLHVVNAGLLMSGGTGIVPCTPRGTMMLLRDYVGDLTGRHAVVIGRSNLFGKPMAQLLLRANCTVTMAHSRTTDLPSVARMADILVVAVGQPEMVKADWVKPGTAVMDVGMNRIPTAEGKTRLTGDVDYDAVYPKASVITPVPGGIGPMTVACLLANTLTATCRQHGIDEPAI